MKGEKSKRLPGPVTAIKWRGEKPGQKKRSGIGMIFLLICTVILAILLVRCDAPSEETQRREKAKTCSACGWEQPHHARNCKNKQ